MDSTPTLSNLLPELFRHILIFVDALDIFKASSVCKRWRKLFQEDALWQFLYETRCRNKETFLCWKSNRKKLIRKNYAPFPPHHADFLTNKNAPINKLNTLRVEQYNRVTQSQKTSHKKNQQTSKKQLHCSWGKAAVILFNIHCTDIEMLRVHLWSKNLATMESPSQGHRLMKAVFCGDSGCGKTSFLMRLSEQAFTKSPPKLCDRFDLPFIWNGTPFSIECCDYNPKDPTFYDDTTFFVICFSVVDPASLENARSMWIRKLRKIRPEAPVILAATKSDLRADWYTSWYYHSRVVHRKITPQGSTPATTVVQGEDMANAIDAVEYVETSALDNTNLIQVIEEGVNSVLEDL